MQLFETMRLEAGMIPRETYHVERISRSAKALDIPFSQREWQQVISDLKRVHEQGCFRLKINLSDKGVLSSEVGELMDKPFMTARLVEIDDDTPFWQRIHKTSERAFLQHDHQTDMVLFYNLEGQLLEFDIGNLVISNDQGLLTPSYHDNFLRGCMRQALLDQGEIKEADLTLHTLKTALELEEPIWMINSLREWVPVRFIES
ncbi:aminotransferase class IV [Staphylococcus sp. IVB6246]|uniref:aminotransferase class IV n=1 Tax=Staphylococcus sp. IVB6246 TaxID=2989772 RepID=UPI0021D1DB95|nr:aminotransferase class IV [Staphylococcus sp. IVB6246]UXR69963.1 aminotransferase class IV [Staphylococcus sp. IVB6246]